MNFELGLSKQRHKEYSKKQGDNVSLPNTHALLPGAE